MCPEVDSASKIEYQDTPGGKDGRKSRKSGALIYRNPLGHLSLSRDTFTFTLYIMTKDDHNFRIVLNEFKFY
jgi:hypothetical protein